MREFPFVVGDMITPPGTWHNQESVCYSCPLAGNPIKIRRLSVSKYQTRGWNSEKTCRIAIETSRDCHRYSVKGEKCTYYTVVEDE